MKKIFIPLVVFMLGGILCSCLGAEAEIVLKAGGAGTLNLEYRAARYFQNIGALDGNARWPTVPVDRADFDRSIARLNAGRPDAVKLSSFSVREDGPDTVYRAAVDFSRLEDILPLLDYGGTGVMLIRGEPDSLTLNFRPAPGPVDPELLVLAEEALRGYNITMRFTAPSPVELRVQGGGDLRIEQEGGKAGFSVPLYQLISRDEPLRVDFLF
ncbi:MAG: hypothetical protein LBK77_02685 [Spirochaetaceae bacterium]|nr:hypothetical protein [Spirochaetaceae bacterium]